MIEKKYCSDCRQVIREAPKFPWGKTTEGYEFEDGWRCPGCAQAHMKKVRSK